MTSFIPYLLFTINTYHYLHLKMSLGQTIADGAKGIHGIGETIRGTINKTVDDAAGQTFENKKDINKEQNEQTIQKGQAEMKKGEAAVAYE